MRHWRLFVGALVSLALVVGVSAVVLGAGEGSEVKKPDIVDTLIKMDDCKTLVNALTAAELVETLKGEGPFTVFATTDAAWEKMPELTHFIIPGGCELGCRLHVARTVCRRTERALARAAEIETRYPPAVFKYLNRHSDLLFALARLANHCAGCPDVVWEGRSG